MIMVPVIIPNHVGVSAIGGDRERERNFTKGVITSSIVWFHFLFHFRHPPIQEFLILAILYCIRKPTRGGLECKVIHCGSETPADSSILALFGEIIGFDASLSLSVPLLLSDAQIDKWHGRTCNNNSVYRKTALSLSRLKKAAHPQEFSSFFRKQIIYLKGTSGWRGTPCCFNTAATSRQHAIELLLCIRKKFQRSSSNSSCIL